MPTTYQEAIDAMFTVINDELADVAPGIIGSVPTVYWQGVEPRDMPLVDEYCLHVYNETLNERQSTIGCFVGAEDQRRFTSFGILYIDVFAPIKDPLGMENGRALAAAIRDAFRRTTTATQIFFRNQRLRELTPDNKKYRLTVSVDYEYDSLV